MSENKRKKLVFRLEDEHQGKAIEAVFKVFLDDKK
jgi:hypothetical protein